MKPIVITSGEPAGIGPEIILKAAQQGLPYPCVVLGDRDLFASRAAELNYQISVTSLSALSEFSQDISGLAILHCPLNTPAVPGQLNIANAPYVIHQLKFATDLALSGSARAIVTAPVHKGIINEAGIPFTGHTEFFADSAKVSRVVMMLVHEDFRVALATTHLPLSQVPSAITASLLHETLQILVHDLQIRFHIERPRILVCGLNPHAGEGGHLGREEIEIIQPVIQEWRSKGYNLIGPVPADTAFLPDQIQKSDAILAMYHDQGLPTLKHVGFHHAVNITLGLPFIRTSVDHGTALELAGTGKAHHESLVAAIQLAGQL